MNPNRIKVTVRIDSDLWERFKLIASEQGITAGQKLETALKNHLNGVVPTIAHDANESDMLTQVYDRLAALELQVQSVEPLRNLLGAQSRTNELLLKLIESLKPLDRLSALDKVTAISKNRQDFSKQVKADALGVLTLWRDGYCPLATANGEHELIIDENGEPLPGLIYHHINGNRSHNGLSNCLPVSEKYHRIYHKPKESLKPQYQGIETEWAIQIERYQERNQGIQREIC